MKIRIFTFLPAILLFCSGLKAQLTITSTTFPYKNRVVYMQTSPASIPVLPTMAGAKWDLTGLSKTGDLRVIEYDSGSGHPVFVQASEKSSQWVSFGPLRVMQNRYYIKGSSGYNALGIEYDKQALPLGHLSGNNNDSVKFHDQTNLFSSVYAEFSFPFKMGTSIIRTIPTKVRTEFTLDLALAGFNNTPCYIEHYFTYDQRVIDVVLCDVPGENTSLMEYNLMVRAELMRVDSFFVNGAPANPFLLGSLGVNQSDTVRSYEYRFYNAGSGAQSKAIIYFTDSTYTTPISAEYTPEYEGIVSTLMAKKVPLEVYPNPSSGEGFTVQLAEGENALFTLADITGKQIPVQAINTGNGRFEIVPGTALQPGVYTLQTRQGTGNRVARVIIE